MGREYKDDAHYLREIRKITDAKALLVEIVELQDMLRGDSYYSDFHAAIFETAGKIVADSALSET